MGGLRFYLMSVVGMLVFFSGCASSNTQRQINSLQAQVGVITDELVRLDQSVQDVRSSLQLQESRQQGASSGTVSKSASGAIYRTPSGFELPAADIQEALRNAGYYRGAIDGKVGSATREAVKAFQRDNGLNTDGVVGRKTWERLKVYLKNRIK